MDPSDELKKSIAKNIFAGMCLVLLPTLGLYIAAEQAGISLSTRIALSIGVLIVLGISTAYYIAGLAMVPFQLLRQGILHVTAETSHIGAPDLDTIKHGRELISKLVLDVYNLASRQTMTTTVDTAVATAGGDNMLNATPLPLFTVTKDDKLHFINDAALDFLAIDHTKRQELLGKNINDVLNLTFQNEDTYEAWLNQSRSGVLKAIKSWDRVRLIDANGNPVKQFDMAVSYSKATDPIESVIVLFDHTETYATDDQEISFVSMAVHELRTPLTVMRGYIEVFEDELGPTLSPELKDFMHKMHASAQQLTAFVSNILNVARVEENALVLTLHKQDIGEILKTAINDLELRARVHGKHIELSLAENIPPVAADRISIQEVLNNLVDNAIKYSGNSDKIYVSTNLKDGMIQVDVQDFGVGIPEGVVPKLFDKFYRSHRSKIQIGGTGLGLYLCKAIISAHGGNIWVKSHEGEGSTFSFTLEQYDAQKHATPKQDGITRGAHGWIKNHSMYRQ